MLLDRLVARWTIPLKQEIAAAEARLSAAEDRAAMADARASAYAEALSKWSSRGVPSYDADSLTVWSKNLGFMQDEVFLAAYKSGMQSGHGIGRDRHSADDIHIEWRIHTCCWAGVHAAHLPGDFVECGTNTGIMSLAVCRYVDFNSLGKTFWLFDTFEGVPQEQMTSTEIEANRPAENAMYFPCYDLAKRNFAQYPKAHLVRGRVPDTLSSVEIERVAYLCIDMNIAEPERAALFYFWPKLVSGAIVIFDDYGWSAYHEQKTAHDAFAKSQRVEIMTLPTGQGLLLKP